MSIDRDSVSYRFIDDGKPPQSVSMETVCGVVTEYSIEKVYPLAAKPEEPEDWPQDGGKVYRRRIIVVDPWDEVDAP